MYFIILFVVWRISVSTYPGKWKKHDWLEAQPFLIDRQLGHLPTSMSSLEYRPPEKNFDLPRAGSATGIYPGSLEN